MTEKLQDILKKGWGIWRKNLNLIIPFLLSAVIAIIAIIVFVAVVVGTAMFLSGPNLADGFPLMNMSGIIILAIAAILMIVVIGLISSFFTAGAIGMSKKAVERKKPNLDEMTDYGRRKFIDLFLANILIFILVLITAAITAGIFIGIPFAIGALNMDSLASIAFLIIGIAILVVIMLVLDVALTPVPYALVISDLGALDGIKAGVRFFLDNKLDTFLLWLIIVVLSVGTRIILEVINIILSFIPVIGLVIYIVLFLIYLAFTVLVLPPLSTVWFSYLYMDRTK